MDKIYDKLDQLGIEEEELPKEFQVAINLLNERTEQHEASMKNLEQEGNLSSAEIDSIAEGEDESLDEEEDRITELLNNYYVSSENFSNNQVQNSYGQNTTQSIDNQFIKKNKSNAAWVVFGIFAAIVTLGAVNTFKK